jgi:hypothetical protein
VAHPGASLIPFTESGLATLPGGETAVAIRRRRGVTTAYKRTLSNHWSHWVAFCAQGNGQGSQYDIYGFSIRKFRVFGGWLIEKGITRACELNVWRSALNHAFARMELGRPARGYDVQVVINEWNAEQVAARGERDRAERRQRLVRAPTTERWVRRLVELGSQPGIPRSRLFSIAVILLAVLFGMRAHTLGGCQAGDCHFICDTAGLPHTLVYMFRCVKKWPELRTSPAARERKWPDDSGHPRASVMRVIWRAYRRDRDFVVTALASQVPARASVEVVETRASAVVTEWVRGLIPDPSAYGVNMTGGTHLASHSPRIMFASACDAVPYPRNRVRHELFWRSEQSMLPYIRLFPYSQWLALLYDFLS